MVFHTYGESQPLLEHKALCHHELHSQIARKSLCPLGSPVECGHFAFDRRRSVQCRGDMRPLDRDITPAARPRLAARPGGKAERWPGSRHRTRGYSAFSCARLVTAVLAVRGATPIYLDGGFSGAGSLAPNSRAGASCHAIPGRDLTCWAAATGWCPMPWDSCPASAIPNGPGLTNPTRARVITRGPRCQRNR